MNKRTRAGLLPTPSFAGMGLSAQAQLFLAFIPIPSTIIVIPSTIIVIPSEARNLVVWTTERIEKQIVPSLRSGQAQDDNLVFCAE